MDIRQLQAFIAVYEERNITAAATRLHLTQPTLSVTIRQLESTLETTLFLRQARGVGLSEAAHRLYPRARKLVAEAQSLRALFHGGAPACRQLQLGIEGEPGQAQIETVLTLATRHDPDLQLTLRQGCQGEARLATDSDRCEDEQFLALWEEPYGMVLRHDHPLAGLAALSAADLQSIDWVVCPEHASHGLLMPWYDNQQHAPCFAAQATSFAQVLALVTCGIGLALLPPSLVHGRAALTWRPLPSSAPRRRVGLCYHETARANPALAALLEQLQQHARLAAA